MKDPDTVLVAQTGEIEFKKLNESKSTGIPGESVFSPQYGLILDFQNWQQRKICC